MSYILQMIVHLLFLHVFTDPFHFTRHFGIAQVLYQTEMSIVHLFLIFFLLTTTALNTSNSLHIENARIPLID